RIPLRTVRANHAPALAPLSALQGVDLDRLQLDVERCQAHRDTLRAVDGLAEKLRRVFQRAAEFPPPEDPELALYGGGFLPDADRRLLGQVRATPPLRRTDCPCSTSCRHGARISPPASLPDGLHSRSITMPKTYFTPATFRFLRALARNNQREWFQAHKDDYERHVREPFLQLITDMQAPLAKISPHYRADPRKNGGSLYRIYRDTRYSNNKLPYKPWQGSRFTHE